VKSSTSILQATRRGWQATRRGWRVLPAVVLTAVVVACGGGYGGMGNSSAPPAASSGPASVSVGAITGFGSVHLNGKKFQTTSASITVDGRAATQGDLHVGDVIEVKGHHDSTSNTDIADQIEMHSNVQGPVSSIDTLGQKLVVLGQTVLVSADTSFDSAISPASLAGIAAGDILEVSGLPAANGDIQATRIERKPAGTAFHAIGTAAATTPGKTLKINALTVDLSRATLVDFPASGPQDGDLVEADGTTLGSAGELQATRLELRSGKELKADRDGGAEIEGVVTRFNSTADFDVGGRPVNAASSPAFEGGSASDLGLNVRVEVEGTIDANGVLVATKVRIERAPDIRILAQADAVDGKAGTVTLLGIQISVTAMTRFEDHGSQKVDTFSAANVNTGDWLEIRGTESPAGSNQVVASRLERREAQPNVAVAGAVKTATQPALTILSVAVATTAATQFSDASGAATTAAAFFTGLTGRTAFVLGSWDGTTLMASKASLGENEEE
jgi:cytoskeletal protein CcmA (bactofilin family)